MSSWLDVKLPTRDMAAMKEGVCNSDTCICVVTNNGKDSYFSRPNVSARNNVVGAGEQEDLARRQDR